MTVPAIEQIAGCPNYSPGRPFGPDRILLHTMVGTITSANGRFMDPNAQVSAHLGVSATRRVQWVDLGDTGWHAGDWPYNQRSIGIENEDGGHYDDPRPDALYVNLAQTIYEVCKKYPDIPIVLRSGIDPPGPIADHRDVHATACPDALDTVRAVRQAAQIVAGLAQTVMGAPTVSKATLASYIAVNAPQAPPGLADAIWAAALEFGVRPEVMLAQQIKETGHYTYPGTDPVFSADATYNNFCGIKTYDGKATARFLTVPAGCVAQAAHLRWYADPNHADSFCARPFDPRHFGTSHKNNVTSVADLGGKWSGSADYGTSMLPEIDRIMAYTGGEVGFDPIHVQTDKDWLDERVRQIVMGEDIAPFAVRNILSRALGSKGIVRAVGTDARGHGHGLATTPPRGPKRKVKKTAKGGLR